MLVIKSEHFYIATRLNNCSCMNNRMKDNISRLQIWDQDSKVGLCCKFQPWILGKLSWLIRGGGWANLFCHSQLILAEIDSLTQFQNLRKLLAAFESDCDTFLHWNDWSEAWFWRWHTFSMFTSKRRSAGLRFTSFQPGSGQTNKYKYKFKCKYKYI